MITAFKRLFRKGSPNNEIIVVSGLPRSGTSLMMKVLFHQNFNCMFDNIRAADEDNPGGYFEYHKVKDLPEGESVWLQYCRGKVIKIVSQYLNLLPSHETYKIIYLKRDMNEIVCSQKKMLERKSRRDILDEFNEKEHFELLKSLRTASLEYINNTQNMSYLEIDYRDLLYDHAKVAGALRGFLDAEISKSLIQASVDDSLYRNRVGNSNV